MATRADLFKYRHSRGRKLDPLSGRLATKEREHSSLIINDELFISHWIFLIPNNSKISNYANRDVSVSQQADNFYG